MKKRDLLSDSDYARLKPLYLPACVYFTENCGCESLRVTECMGVRCAFLQTVQMRQEAQAKWLCTLNAFSDEKQVWIALRYFGGKMPWKQQKEGACSHVS